MSSPNRTLRERLRELERYGFTVVAVHRSKHWQIDAITPNGRQALLVASMTPSDRRVGKHFTAQLKRLSRSEAARHD